MASDLLLRDGAAGKGTVHRRKKGENNSSDQVTKVSTKVLMEVSSFAD